MPKKEGRNGHRRSPLFKYKDVLQVIIGASILAIPVGFTEETWRLGGFLPWLNILGFVLLSLFFIAAFSYYHYYHNRLENHYVEFLKRVIWTYVLSFIVVGTLLTLIQAAPWFTVPSLAIKRTVIVTFPASLSGAVADVIK